MEDPVGEAEKDGQFAKQKSERLDWKKRKRPRTSTFAV